MCFSLGQDFSTSASLPHSPGWQTHGLILVTTTMTAPSTAVQPAAGTATATSPPTVAQVRGPGASGFPSLHWKGKRDQHFREILSMV